MESLAFGAVLLAALLHALWNSLLKRGDDKFIEMTGIILWYAPVSILVLWFAPTPASESLPFILVSIVLHTAYHYFLLSSYQLGDLTHVYPIARGSAPLIVTFISVVFLGFSLSSLELIALLLIISGVFSLSLVKSADGLAASKANKLAFVTGIFIAAYTINDGIGARLSGTAIGYFAWVGLGSAIAWLVLVAALRPGVLRNLPMLGAASFIVGGNASFVAYTLVVWAYTQAPIHLVSALREVSIVFAMLIGVGVLKEKLDCRKILSTMLAVFGAALLKLSR